MMITTISNILLPFRFMSYGSRLPAVIRNFSSKEVQKKNSVSRISMKNAKKNIQNKNVGKPFEVESNVASDVLIYSFENAKFFKMVTAFGIAQFGFWAYLAVFTYTSLRDIKPEEEAKLSGKTENIDGQPWWKTINLGQNKYRNGISFMCATIGYILLFISLAYPGRGIRNLYLLRGGNAVKIDTFSPFPGYKSFNTPLENVSCLQNRVGKESHISMKIKDRYLFFLLDKKGTFHNAELYDYAVGLQRP